MDYRNETCIIDYRKFVATVGGKRGMGGGREGGFEGGAAKVGC